MMPGTHEYALRSLALAQGTDPTAPAGSATLGFHASGGRVGFPDNTYKFTYVRFISKLA
jgi:hypothetical protein